MYQPKGTVGIIGTWNAPLFTLFSPLASALGAGNLYEIAYARWQDPVLLLPVIRAGRRSLEAMLYGADLGNAPDFKLQSTIFPAAGWAVLRSRPPGRWWTGA